MSNYIEIEKKFYASNDDKLKSFINNQGFECKGSSLEQDIYFTDNSGKYVKNRTCLRFRNKGKEDDSFSIDFKGKSKELSSLFSKVESNICLSKSVSESTYQLLSNLGYQKYVTVNKNRTTYTKTDVDITYSIVIDKISGIGVFFEAELTCPVELYDQEKANEIFLTQFKDILDSNFEEANLPYRDFLANKIKLLWLNDTKTILIDCDSALDIKKAVADKKYKDGDFFFGNLKSISTQYQNPIALEEINSINYLSSKYDLKFITNKDVENTYKELLYLGINSPKIIPLENMKNSNAIAITAKKEMYEILSDNNIKTAVKLGLLQIEDF